MFINKLIYKVGENLIVCKQLRMPLYGDNRQCRMIDRFNTPVCVSCSDFKAFPQGIDTLVMIAVNQRILWKQACENSVRNRNRMMYMVLFLMLLCIKMLAECSVKIYIEQLHSATYADNRLLLLHKSIDQR